MAVELFSGRPWAALHTRPTTVRAALSWRRGSGAGLQDRVKRILGMNLDLVIGAFREEGDLVGLFLPPGVPNHQPQMQADWVWHTNDEKRGGRSVWDESALLDLELVPPVVKKIVFAVAAVQYGTSFDRVPSATLDLYDQDARLLVQVREALDRGPVTDPCNLAGLMALVRSSDGAWKAERSNWTGQFVNGDLGGLRQVMEVFSGE